MIKKIRTVKFGKLLGGTGLDFRNQIPDDDFFLNLGYLAIGNRDRHRDIAMSSAIYDYGTHVGVPFLPKANIGGADDHEKEKSLIIYF